MLATIKALKDNPKIWCKFPARASYLSKRFPTLKIEKVNCPKLEERIKLLNAHSISLIFPTAHINSPASMYGHTFLRLDINSSTPLISNALNYSAKTDETNGIIFAFKGIFGGYQGKYSILPYYEKIKEYNNLERRDIWEYQLNLTQKEIDKIILHIQEILPYYSDYFFFKENCSYNLLWFLELARPKSNLVEKFTYKAIPIDTIREIKRAGFIKSVSYRPSKTKIIKAILSKIEDKEKAIKSIKENDFSILNSVDRNQKIYILDLAIAILEKRRVKNRISKKRYIKSLLKLLKKRSKLKKGKKITIERPTNPLNSHYSSKISLEYQNRGNLYIGFKPAFHDIFDVKEGYKEGAYISFFETKVKVKNRKRLEYFNFINLKSYAKRDILFKPLSWQVAFGFQQFEDKLYSYISTGAGVTYGEENFFYYFMITPSLFYKNDTIGKIGGEIGLIKNYQKYKIGVDIKRNFYSNSYNETLFNSFITYQINHSFAINLNYLYKKENNFKLSLFYYF